MGNVVFAIAIAVAVVFEPVAAAWRFVSGRLNPERDGYGPRVCSRPTCPECSRWLAHYRGGLR